VSKYNFSLSERQKAGLTTGVFGLSCNLVLSAAKIVTGLISNSIAIYSDGMNNMLDSLSALTVIFSFCYSGKRKDKEHPHGHGRSEYIGGFVISFLILVTAATLGQQSIARIIEPEKIQTTPVLFVVLVASVVMKIGMALFYRRRNRKVNSTVLSASSRDSLSDAFTTTAIIIAMIFAPLSDLPIDGVVSLLLVLFIARQGLVSFFENFTFLLGKSTDPKTLRLIRRTVLATASFTKVSAIDMHDYGPEQHSAIIKAELKKGVHRAQLETDITAIKHQLKSKHNIDATIYWPPEA
jgi:cation diffusion facilitator family transporter